MKTLSEDFENFASSNHYNIVEGYLSSNPYVKEIKLLIGNNYKLVLKLDSETTMLFNRYLLSPSPLERVGVRLSPSSSEGVGVRLKFNPFVFKTEYINQKPFTTLLIDIPVDDDLETLKNIKSALILTVENMAYERFRRDFKNEKGALMSKKFNNHYEPIPNVYFNNQKNLMVV